MPVLKNPRARGWTLLSMAFLAVVLFAFWNVGRRAIHMETAAAASDGQQVEAAKAGTQLKAVLQLTSIADGSAEGTLLEKHDNAYRRTDQRMQVKFSNDVAVVMGSLGDVHKDAIVHVTGTVGPGDVLQVSRFVILTGNVSVE